MSLPSESSHILSCFRFFKASILTHFTFIANLTDHIQTSANADEEETGADYDKHFPDFLWVVRDFALQKSLSDDAYLEDALKSKPGSKPALVEANNLRQVIRDMFKVTIVFSSCF